MNPQDKEWLEQPDWSYHERQLEQPYRSTVCFCDWLDTCKLWNSPSGGSILDIGCGMGAVSGYMGRRYPNWNFVGLDYNSEMVQRGNEFLRIKEFQNVRLQEGDLYQLPASHRSQYQGIVSLQTLSWLPDWKEPLQQMMSLNSKWIALSSLFYDGNIECSIRVRNFGESSSTLQKESFYNIYSLRLIRDFLAEGGYTNFYSTPFSMDVDLPRPAHKEMGTYTEKLASGDRLQISGPLLMPWHFVLAQKE